MRTPFVCGNWKMNTTLEQALTLVDELVPVAEASQGVRVAVAPPSIWLGAVVKRCAGTRIDVFAQNIGYLEAGALTGEISAAMVKESGARGTIIGHSERRSLLGQTDEQVNRAVHLALKQSLDVILCVGESLESRDAGETKLVVLGQLSAGLAGVQAADLAQLTIAYEPVWAIGTGRTASPAQAAEVHEWIRTWLTQHFGPVGSRVVIQYGGSVKGSNAADLMSQPDVDGALVGGASLVSAEFAAIVAGAGA